MKKFFFVFLILAGTCSGTFERETPWIEPVLQPVLLLGGGYQSYYQIHSGDCYLRYPGSDYFVDAGLFFAPSADLGFEMEFRGTRSHQHGFALDSLSQTGYLSILDDALGDPLALTLGLKLSEPISFGLKDPSFIHHALFESELELMIGKEWTSEAVAEGRVYALGAFGVATRGSPWLRGFFAADCLLCSNHRLEAKLLGEMGFGGRNFRLCHFYGYGSMAYRLVDAEIGYTYLGECGEVSLYYLHSLYRKNLPARVSQVILNFNYPFAL